MGGIISGVNYGLLFSGAGSASSIAGDMLTTLYTTPSSGSTATSTGNPILDLKLAEQNETTDVATEAKNPTVVRALDLFNQGLSRATTVTQALQNPNVLNVLLTANGMSDQDGNTALATKALLSDPTDPNSLVNQLSDTRWKTLAQTYDLSSKGLAGLQDATVQSQIAQQYEQVTWLNSLDQATPGLAQAIQFKKQASQITNVDQILGDPTNWAVVLTALGIPQQIAYQSTSAQEQEVSSRVNIADFQNPNFVNTITDQYLLTMQQQSQSSSSSSTSLTSLAVQSTGILA